VAKVLRIEVASDVICPWCYIGGGASGLALLDGEVELQIDGCRSKTGRCRLKAWRGYRRAKFTRPAREGVDRASRGKRGEASSSRSTA
jgi:hypothetical protein